MTDGGTGDGRKGAVGIHNARFYGSDETSRGQQSGIFHRRTRPLNARLIDMGKIPSMILMDFYVERRRVAAALVCRPVGGVSFYFIHLVQPHIHLFKQSGSYLSTQPFRQLVIQPVYSAIQFVIQ